MNFSNIRMDYDIQMLSQLPFEKYLFLPHAVSDYCTHRYQLKTFLSITTLQIFYIQIQYNLSSLILRVIPVRSSA